MALPTVQPGASTLMVPAVWVSSPARMRSSVDFPQPDGPTMQTNSPGATRSEMSSSATRRPAPQVLLAQAGNVDRRPAPLNGHPPAPPGTASPAAGELARFVLELPRPGLRQRILDVALVDHPLGRKLHVAHLALHEP